MQAHAVGRHGAKCSTSFPYDPALCGAGKSVSSMSGKRQPPVIVEAWTSLLVVTLTSMSALAQVIRPCSPLKPSEMLGHDIVGCPRAFDTALQMSRLRCKVFCTTTFECANDDLNASQNIKLARDVPAEMCGQPAVYQCLLQLVSRAHSGCARED